MSTFEERIAKAVTDKLNDGTVEELVSDAVTKALKSSIEDQFNWKGEGEKIIDEKVKEAMTPAIERVNLDEYTVKLDAVLTEKRKAHGYGKKKGRDKVRKESLIHKILRKLGFIKDIEDDREFKMEMCKRAIKANVCPEDCDICAWDVKGGSSYENH